MSLEIDKYSFGTQLKNLELLSYVDALESYRGALSNALDLSGSIPIFLDTNVLLRFYSISFLSRSSFYNFLKKYRKRIYLTSQVQREFVKNREDIIERFFNETLIKLEANFRDEVSNKTQSYIERNKTLLSDFPSFETKLKKLFEDVKKTQEELVTEIESVKTKLAKTKNQDELLTLIREFNLVSLLSDDDKKFLIGEFDGLKKNIDLSKIKNELTKPQVAFPGSGDLKEKPDYPYGDYFLFHEMLKFAKNNSKDIIFLTYDTTKGDWIKDNKEPHSHYIQIANLATGQNIFYVDADRFFDKHLNKHFNSLVPKIDYYSPKFDFEKDFILEFVGLERIIRTIADFVVIENAEYAPLHTLVDVFVERQFVDPIFKDDFRELSSFRNILLHVHDRSTIDSIPQQKFINLLSKLRAAIEEMKDLYSDL